jgi:tungstate transport system substrate-binding protein
MLRNNTTTIALIIIVIAATGGFYFIRSQKPPGARTLVVSTTTSLYDTGVLDRIEDAFEAENPIDLYFISVGTGLAITHAQRGDADMILVHAPSRELAFMEAGYGVNRKIIAYNYFSIVGPADDPAGIRDKTPQGALETLVENGRAGEALWVSRGDDSGTHTKERELWSEVGFDASALGDEEWYREAGTGMGKTLQIAEEYEAYTLTDMGTFLKYSNDGLVTLEVLVGAGEELINVYSAISVNPESNPDANFKDAIAFTGYLASDVGQSIFGGYGVETYGINLFNPAVEPLSTGSDPTTVAWIKAAGFFEASECPEEYRRGDTRLYADEG